MIRIVLLLLSVAILYVIFFNYVYPFFTKDKKPGWLFKNDPVDVEEFEKPEEPTEDNDKQ